VLTARRDPSPYIAIDNMLLSGKLHASLGIIDTGTVSTSLDGGVDSAL